MRLISPAESFASTLVKSASDRCRKCGKPATVLVLWAEGMGGIPACEDHKVGFKEQKERTDDFSGFRKVADVNPYQQKTQWSCSAACLSAVAAHLGKPVSEEEAIAAVGAREGRGAEVDELAEGARKLGFSAFDFCFDSLEQAKLILDKDIPIICDIQSFNHPGKGHYVVLTKIDEAGVHLMDPNTPGNERLLTPDHMDARWWDRTMAAPHDLKEKWGVVVVGGTK